MPLHHQQVILVQRQTVDWSSLSDDEFYLQSRQFCLLWGKSENYIWQLFQLWNKTFQADYRLVRQQLKKLSLQNCQNIQHATLVPYQAYNNIPQMTGYYVFLDDDDWVDPEISATLSRHVGSLSTIPPLLLWRSANIGSPNQDHPVFVWGMNGRCMTNNYAVHSDWLKPFSKINQVLQHKDAAILIDQSRQNTNIQTIPHLDCALTVSNKSPISSVSLDRGLNGDFSPEKLKQLVSNYLERMRQVQEKDLAYIPWAKIYLEQMIIIFSKVLDGSK